MTTQRGGRSGGRRRARAVSAVLALALTGCGVGSPPPGPATSAPPGQHPHKSAKPHPSATPSHSPTHWTGTFDGHRVSVPYGHGAAVSFTFDDGPSPTYTPKVLALLAQHHVPAVFCLIGVQARTYPTLVRREAGAGHALCDHSRDHDLNMKAKGKAYVTAEVDDGLADIHRAAPGVAVPFYRQPGGYWNPTVVRAMDRDRLLPLRWSDDPRDWSRPGASVVVHRVVQGLHPGAVILMHDGGGDRSQSVAALSWLLTALPAAGWRLVPAPRKRLSAKAAARPE